MIISFVRWAGKLVKCKINNKYYLQHFANISTLLSALHVIDTSTVVCKQQRSQDRQKERGMERERDREKERERSKRLVKCKIKNIYYLQHFANSKDQPAYIYPAVCPACYRYKYSSM